MRDLRLLRPPVMTCLWVAAEGVLASLISGLSSWDLEDQGDQVCMDRVVREDRVCTDQVGLVVLVACLDQDLWAEEE